jgi:hypothetical protein
VRKLRLLHNDYWDGRGTGERGGRQIKVRKLKVKITDKNVKILDTG